jgi:nicotinamidase-related amidase
VIVVDVQSNFVDQEQPFMRAAERMSPGVTAGYRRRLEHTVMPNIARLVESFRAAGLPIAYTGTGTRRYDRGDLPGWLRGFDELSQSLLGEPMWPQVEDPRWDIDPSLAPAEGDIVMNKTSVVRSPRLTWSAPCASAMSSRSWSRG